MWSFHYQLLILIASSAFTLTFRTPIDRQRPGWSNADILVGNTITSLSYRGYGTIAFDVIARGEGYYKVIAHCNSKSNDNGGRDWHSCTTPEGSSITELRLVYFSAEKPWALKESRLDHSIEVGVKLINNLGSFRSLRGRITLDCWGSICVKFGESHLGEV